MALKERIILEMPMERVFRAVEVADKIYPHLVKYDTEGRLFNQGAAAVARELRKIRGVEERPYGTFFAHEEYFQDIK